MSSRGNSLISNNNVRERLSTTITLIKNKTQCGSPLLYSMATNKELCVKSGYVLIKNDALYNTQPIVTELKINMSIYTARIVIHFFWIIVISLLVYVVRRLKIKLNQYEATISTDRPARFY